MSTMVNDNLQNNDMASNISNLNNMPNIAKNAEYGIENMAHLDNIQNKNIMLPQPMQPQYQVPQQQQQQQQFNMPDTGLYQQQLPQIDTGLDKKKTILDNIMKNLKEPLVVAVIFVILNHPSFLSAVKKYCPTLTPSEDNTVLNLVLRGLIMGGIIVLINKTVLK